LQISSATVLLADDELKVEKIAASLGSMKWDGSLVVPRRCDGTGHCPAHFILHADQIITDELNQLLRPHPAKKPWYRILGPAAQPVASLLGTVQAAGKLSAGRVVVRNVVGMRVSADVTLQAGRLRLTDLQASVLGGRHRGEWQADFTASPPEYSGRGTLEHLLLGQIADAMKDGWIAGTATATYHADMSGRSTAELLASAKATVQFDARDGELSHLGLNGGAPPLPLRHFSGRLALHDGNFEVQEGKLEAASGIYRISGTVSPGRKLDFRLTRDAAHGFSITGTISEPTVTPMSETRAALKP